MKILHILNDGPTTLSDQIISIQSKNNEVKVIDLSPINNFEDKSKKEKTYEDIIDEIFSNDRVMSW